jgi:hypothetical protein
MSKPDLKANPVIEDGLALSDITVNQKAEIITVLQAIAHGHSDSAAHDANILLKKMSGELSGFGESFLTPARQIRH